MIFTRKHIVIAVLFAVVGIAIGIGIKHYETLQTFSSSDIKVVLDAGHGACGKCFKELCVTAYLYDLRLLKTTTS